MRNPSRVHLAVLALVFAVVALTANSFALPALFIGEVTEFQPNIPNGGRANTIAVHPSDVNKIYVASESGGLFRSIDRGVHWRHVDELPCRDTMSVAYLPANPNIVLVTTLDDFKTTSGGGIWRSMDGGFSWVQASMPREIAARRMSAYEISIVPGSGEIYVGSLYGILKSRDQGATWSYQDVYGDGDRINSVVALDRDHILAGSERDLRRSENGGATWIRPSTPLNDNRDIHALSRSPVDSRQAFAVNVSTVMGIVTSLYYSEDFGDHWTQITSATPGGAGCGGFGFARAVDRSIFVGSVWTDGLSSRRIDLFFGNRCQLFKLRIYSNLRSGPFNYGGTWQPIGIDHPDTRDLAFDHAAHPNPILFASDGGLHKTTDGGANWTFTGGGPNGYNALQVTEVQGQLIENILRYDLYFGTWDNNLWASGDDGATWPNAVLAEGMFIEAEKKVPNASESKINLVACAGCVNKISDPLFTNVDDWRNPPTSNFGYVVRIGPSMHIQGVNDSGDFSGGMAVTYDLGTAWQQYAVFPEELRQIPKLARLGDGTHSTEIYAAYRTSGWHAPGNFEINKLMRFREAPRSLTSRVIYPPMHNLGGLGIDVRQDSSAAPYAVDPGNYWHIIAPDVINNKMMETVDGGDHWHEIPGLTSLVTDGGRLGFSKGMSPLVTALSFSPQNPDMVLVGTAEGGLYLSTDNGAHWERIPRSEGVTSVTGFAWKNAGDVIISSYGRGLWRLRGRLIIPISDFRRRCGASCRVSRWYSFSAQEDVAFDRGLLVFDGRIMGARTTNGIVKEVFVSNGSSWVFATEKRKDPGIKITETNKYAGFTGVDTAPKAPQQASLIKGMVFDRDNRIRGAVFGDKPMMMYEPKDMVEQEEKPTTKSPTEGKPYVRLTVKNSLGGPAPEPGEVMLVTSSNLERAADIVIYVDDKPVTKAQANAQGYLRAQVRAPINFGRHSVTIRYARAEKSVIDGTMFLVRHIDLR